MCDELQCDEGWYRIVGCDPAHPVRKVADFRPFIHPEDVERATEVIYTAAELVATNRDYAIAFRIIRPDGETRWVRSVACLVRDECGQAVRAVGFVVDITDARRGELALRAANRALEDERRSLARQTLEDPLTGIANRRYLDGELARICAGAQESADAVCVGMADVDCFKAYNDRYGHLGGDTALRQIASALQSVAGPRDVVARYGGEEFVFVLRDVRDPAPVLQRFVDAVAGLAIPHSDSPTGYLTVSCGCVIVSESGKLTPAALLEASDEALYDAKSAGRNGYVIQTLDAAAVRLNVSPRFDAR